MAKVFAEVEWVAQGLATVLKRVGDVMVTQLHESATPLAALGLASVSGYGYAAQCG
jgi:hypothetical protein